MKKVIEPHKIQIKLLLVLVAGIAILASLFYFLIPNILNYPEGTYNSAFQSELENTNYNIQAVLMAFAIFVVFVVIVLFQTRFLIKYQGMFESPEKYSEKEIRYVRDKLYNTPYTMYVLNIIAPSIIITLIHAFTIKQLGITTLKIFILMFSFITVYVSGVLLYTKKLFKTLLLKLPTINEVCYKRVSIRYRFFYHILPLIIVAILFTALLGYSRVIVEKGNSIYEIYKERLTYWIKSQSIETFEDLQEVARSISLYNEEDIVFIKKPDGTFIDKEGKTITFSAYFNKYLNEVSPQKNGRVYEYYGVDAQGCVQEIQIEGKVYILGVYFEVTSTNLLYYFLAAFISLLLVDIIVLELFASSYSSDIKIVADSFQNMTKQGSKRVVEKLPVTSNDEVGDLCIAFNNVQDLTTQYIEQIHSSQDILVERERLASLGQMIGRNSTQTKNANHVHIRSSRRLNRPNKRIRCLNRRSRSN